MEKYIHLQRDNLLFIYEINTLLVFKRCLSLFTINDSTSFPEKR